MLGPMFRPSLLALLAVCLPLCAPAEPAMSAAEFDRYTQGKTLYYGFEGEPYGVERYRDNRRVTWSFLDGRCKDGQWYDGPRDQICFTYEDEPGPHCWQFFLRGGRLIARLGDNPDDIPVYEAAEDPEPMLCLGPEIGV